MTHSRYQEKPYYKRIKALTETRYANLKFLMELMDKPVEKTHPVSSTIIDFSAKGSIEYSRHENQDFSVRKMGECRTLFIIEDLSRDIVERLGDAFDIEPQFFNDHLRAVEWEHYYDKSNAVMLPSVRRTARYWTLRYWEPVSVIPECKTRRTELCGLNVYRKILFRTPKVDAHNTPRSVGFVTRFVSFWQRRHKDGYFEAVVLVDPPLAKTFEFRYIVDRRVLHHRDWEPYGGGYVDFVRIGEECKDSSSTAPHPEDCIRRDIQLRLSDSSRYVEAAHPLERTSYLLQKIVLSYWMLSIALLQRDYNSLELSDLAKESILPSSAGPALNNLMDSRNLLIRCNRWARANIFQLGIAPTDDLYYRDWQEAGETTDHHLLACDWTYLIYELKSFTEETEKLIEQHMQNLQTLDSKRQFLDTKIANRSNKLAQENQESVNKITVLGQLLLIIFTPMSCAYGILSMGGNFAPGSRSFWVFWAIAIPLIIVTGSVFYLYVGYKDISGNKDYTGRGDSDEEIGLDDDGYVEGPHSALARRDRPSRGHMLGTVLRMAT